MHLQPPMDDVYNFVFKCRNLASIEWCYPYQSISEQVHVDDFFFLIDFFMLKNVFMLSEFFFN